MERGSQDISSNPRQSQDCPNKRSKQCFVQGLNQGHASVPQRRSNVSCMKTQCEKWVSNTHNWPRSLWSNSGKLTGEPSAKSSATAGTTQEISAKAPTGLAAAGLHSGSLWINGGHAARLWQSQTTPHACHWAVEISAQGRGHGEAVLFHTVPVVRLQGSPATAQWDKPKAHYSGTRGHCGKVVDRCWQRTLAPAQRQSTRLQGSPGPEVTLVAGL